MKLIEWLRARVGFPAGDAGVFTSGGTQSNLMGLMLARDAFFARQATPSSRMGCRGYPQVQSLVLGKRPLLGAEEHGADGPGYRSVTLVKTDEFARMDVSDLQAKIAQAQANGRSWRSSPPPAPPTQALSTAARHRRYRCGTSDLAAR